MKNIWKYISTAALAVFALVACKPEYPVLVQSGLPSASDFDVTITVDQATNQATFTLNNKGMVPVWNFGSELIDGKASKVYAYTGNGVTLRFREAGEHQVEVKAYNVNGLSTGSVLKTFTMNETYRDPFDPSPYIRAVSGGASQDWVWNSTEKAHFGCGPAGDPLAWWQCDANGKAGFLYDDVMTFDSEGNYTFNPGDGQAYAKNDAEYPEGHAVETDDYLFPAELSTSKYSFENSWNDAGIEEIYLTLAPGSILSYVIHKSLVASPRYQVLETKTSEMKKKLKLMGTASTPNNGDGISFYYEFVPKGSNAGAADPLFGLESKTWVPDNETAGYMGCGPDFGNSGGWWSAQPHEKDAYGVTDDELTFFANGKYVFSPGADGMVYCNWESGWRPDGYYSGDGSTDYDAPAEVIESAYTVGSDATGDYIELPAGVLYGYIPKPQVLSDVNRLYIKELTANKLFLVANFDGISWQFIYRPKDGVAPEPEPIVEPIDPTDYDVNGAGNLWKGANLDVEFWYANGGWSQIGDPEYDLTAGNGIKVTIPDGVGGSEWMGQTKLKSHIASSADKTYDFSVTLLASEDMTVTIKLTNDPEESDDIHSFFYDGGVKLTAGEPLVYRKSGLKQNVSGDNVMLIFDFGRSPVGSVIEASEILFQEHKTGNLWEGANLDVEFWYANGGWSQIGDPEYDLTAGNGIKVTIPDGVGGSEWMGQTKLKSHIASSADKTYDFSVTLLASEDMTVTIKLTNDPEESDDIHSFFYDGGVKLTADEPLVYVKRGVKQSVSGDNVMLIFDFGRSPIGSNIEASNIVFMEQK